MFTHGKGSRVLANGFDVSAFFRETKYSSKSDTADSSTYGKDAHTYKAGLIDGVVRQTGLFDGDTNAIDSILFPALAVDNGGLWVYLPQGDAVGQLAYGAQGVEHAYEVDSTIKDVVMISSELQISGGRDRMAVYHEVKVEVATGAGIVTDGGALSANGGVGYLHVLAMSGISILSVIIEDSADGLSFLPVLSFTNVTVAPSSEKVVITGTVRRYTKVIWTFTGSGTAKFHASFGRT